MAISPLHVICAIGLPSASRRKCQEESYPCFPATGRRRKFHYQALFLVSEDIFGNTSLPCDALLNWDLVFIKNCALLYIILSCSCFSSMYERENVWKMEVTGKAMRRMPLKMLLRATTWPGMLLGTISP